MFWSRFVEKDESATSINCKSLSGHVDHDFWHTWHQSAHVSNVVRMLISQNESFWWCVGICSPLYWISALQNFQFGQIEHLPWFMKAVLVVSYLHCVLNSDSQTLRDKHHTQLCGGVCQSLHQVSKLCQIIHQGTCTAVLIVLPKPHCFRLAFT